MTTPTPVDFTGLDFGTPAAAAAACIATGLCPLPIAYRSKNPNLKGWQNLRLKAEDISRNFNGEPQNIGVLLGEPSGRLLDVDGDCREAVALMPVFLPETGAIFGRPGKPSSHRLYTGTGPVPKTTKYTDIDGKTCLIELRSTGGQTVFPPSTHEVTGEPIRFERQGVAAAADPIGLNRAVAKVAGAAILTKRWSGTRHDLALSIAGMLLKSGWDREQTAQFVEAIARAGGDEELDDRLKAVADTAAKFEAGGDVSGVAKLTEIVGEEVVARVRKWLFLGKGGAGAAGKNRGVKKGPYIATPGGIVVEYKYADGSTEQRPLTNFSAAITSDIVEDDGAEQVRHIDLRCELRGRPSEFRIPIASFQGMNWPIEKLGPSAIVESGMGTRDQARAAIQHLSDPDLPRKMVYTHTGWRKVDGVGWVYLNAGGPIGPVGRVFSLETRLEGALALFCLPEPPSDNEDRVTAIQASMGLLRLAPARIAVPGYASIWRAALGGTDLGMFSVGPTGAFKTEHAALHQQHFGPEMDRLHLPGGWQSTDNALEDMLFRAKDTLAVIDDFKPSGNVHEDGKLHARADRVFRGAGNSSGRNRMRADLSLRPPRPPRALPFGTGEELPRGHSLRARLVINEIGAGDIDPARLTVCQRDAARGLYAQAMALFVQWVAQRYEQVRTRLRERTAELRDSMGARHRRTPSNIATLMAALEIFVDFVADTTGEEALTKAEAAECLEDWRRALDECARGQEEAHAEADPVPRYIELLGAAITSGRAYLSDPDGNAPQGTPEAWGWRLEPVGKDRNEWKPQGDQIGWVEDEHVYLEPDAAFKAAQGMAGANDQLPVTEKRLRKLLKERGMLALIENARKSLLYRITLQGVQRPVLAIQAHHLRRPAQTAQTAHEPG